MSKLPCAVILTALQVEYEAVRRHLTDPQEETHPSGTIYERGQFKASDGTWWEVGLVEIGAGNPRAAVEAERAISYFNPQVAFFVGLAGGIKDVQLGDVVVATRVYGYESGKEEETFKSHPDVGQSAHALQQRALAVRRKGDWRTRLEDQTREPQVYVAPIAAGGKVLVSTDSDTLKLIRRNYNDAIAVEMEGRGFLDAAHANQQVKALIIRGISTLIDGRAEDEARAWQKIAAVHASAFAFEVLAKLPATIATEGEPAPEPNPTLPTRPTEPSFPIVKLPYAQNPNFTGREELLAQVEQSLKSKKPAAIVQAISGLGGVGKTQLALEYAYRHLAEYDIVWWIGASEEATLIADYAALGRELVLIGEAVTDQKLIIDIVRQGLERGERKWLLIFDNAEEPNQLQPYLPQRGNGHILITSRNQSWGRLAKPLSIYEFSPEEAIKFLLRRTGREHEIGARTLSYTLGSLPLALEQAGAYMEVHGTSFVAYLNLFQDHQREILDRPPQPPDYRATVATTWELAFQKVQESSPAAATLLNLCAFFAPDDIPRQLLVDGAFYLPEVLAEAVADPLDFDDAIAALRRYSLIRNDGTYLSVHRLVQAVARDRLEMEEAKHLATVAISLVNEAFPFDEYKVETWEESARLLPHALSVANRAENYSVALAITAHLLHQAGVYLHKSRGEYSKAAETLQHALGIREKVSKKIDFDKAEILNYLGVVATSQANFPQAKLYHEEALAVQQQLLGEGDRAIARSLHNLGTVYKHLRSYKIALQYYEKALAMFELELGFNHGDTATCLNSLGTLLQDQSNYKAAQRYYEQALIISQHILGDKHTLTATLYHNLGSLFIEQKKFADADKYIRKSLMIREALLGIDHPHTAGALSVLGNLMFVMQNYPKAREYWNRSLSIYLARLGPEHPDTQVIRANLKSLPKIGKSQGRKKKQQKKRKR